MDIEFTSKAPPSIAFYMVPQGTVFSCHGEYYIRIESAVDSGFVNATIINCVRLSDGATKHLDNNEQVLIVPAKLVIN